MSHEIQMKTKNQKKLFQMTCQNCHKQYFSIKDFKGHVRSFSHKKEVAEQFQTAVHKGPVHLPMVFVLDYLRTPNRDERLVGLDMVTLCITAEKYGCFYLCHICEKNLSCQEIIDHLCSADHYFKHLAHSNPELLRFAWSEDSFSYLKSSALKENTTNGPGTLRILDLPKMLLKRGKKLGYHKVMTMFSETVKLTDRVKAHRPQRKTLQAYSTDAARTYPLLGLNFLLEYSCPDSEWYCGYLCILCKKKFPGIDSISHCISFDHVYSYMREVHPGTLELSRGSYTQYSFSFNKKILYLADQAQKTNPPKEIQVVSVDLSEFKVIDFSSYKNALDKLQQIRLKLNQSEFAANITPGKQILFGPDTDVSSASLTPTAISAEPEAEKTQKDSATEFKEHIQQILCVECDQTVHCISEYKKHIKGVEHRLKYFELFGSGFSSGQHPSIADIKLYHYLYTRNGKHSPAPLIGLHLLTVLVDRQSPCSSSPVYLCHACEISISTAASTHLTSTQHYFNTFAHTNPDRVFLGHQNYNQLISFAKEEEARQEKMLLRVCEVPKQLCRPFKSLPYEKIMASIEKQHPKMIKCNKVPMRVTLQSYAKRADRKSPLLGLQFMVKYSTKQPYQKHGYLCLLCEKKLSEVNAVAHVLSFGHVFAYLDVAHPGSLTKDDNEQRSLILDLAQQAELINPGDALKEVELDFGKFNEIDTNPFKTAWKALEVVFQQKGLGELKPSVVPGAKLVCSSEKKKSSQCIKQTPEQIELDAAHTETLTPKMDVQSPNIIPQYTECEKPTDPAVPAASASASVQPSSTTSTLSALPEASLQIQLPEQLEMKMEHLSQAVLPLHKAAEEICHTAQSPQPHDTVINHETTSKLPQNPAEQLEAPQNLEKSSVPLNKGPEVSQNSPELCKYLKRENRKPVIGLNSVIECHSDGQPPFFVCVPCTERVKENTLIEHLISQEHQIMYLETIYGPPLSTKKLKKKWLRNLEQREGTGETQILELNTEEYRQIFTVPIFDALRKLRDLLLKLTPEIGFQSAVASSWTDSPRCDERPESSTSIKEENDHPSDPPREAAMSETSKSDPVLKQSSDDDPAQSSPHLWSYLTSPSRTEPVIGLSMVTEYRRFSGQNSFLCSCCKVMQPTSQYQCHLISPKHRFSYMKEKHPELVEKWKNDTSLTAIIPKLHAKAHILQDKEGWGHLKVVKKEPPKLNEQTETAENSTVSQESEPSSSSVTEEQRQTGKRLKLTKQLKKKKIKKHSAFIGLNFMTCVTHGKKKLFFCDLCSVKCNRDHISSVTHRKTCVEHKYPGLTVTDANMEKLALRLVAMERSTGIGMKKLNVTAKVFTALSSTPICEALSQLKLQQKKIEFGVDLRGSQASAELGSSTESDQTYGISNNVESEVSSVQQEQAFLPETAVLPDGIPNSLSGSHSICIPSVSSVHVSTLQTITNTPTLLPNPGDPSFQSPSSIDLQISTQPASVPMTLLPTPIPDLPALSSSQPVYEPISPPTVYESISPPTVYEPISPPTQCEPILPPTQCEPILPPTQCKPISPPTTYESISPPTVYESISPPTVYESISPPNLGEPILPQTQCEPILPPTLCKPISPPNLGEPIHPPTVYESISPPNLGEPILPQTLCKPISPPTQCKPISPPNLGEPIYPPTLCKPISPSNHCEPILLPSADDCQSASHPAVSYSSRPPSASSQTSSTYISTSQHNKSHPIDGEDAAFANPTRSTPQTSESQFGSAQFFLREESRPLVSASSQMYSFLNLPTVVGQSNASLFLHVRNTKPIIGLSNIVECSTMFRSTFFLCLNCAEKISNKDFCFHMTSERHQYFSLRFQYPEIFQLQSRYKLTLHQWAEKLALKEHDAKVIKLDQKQYASLESADFLSAIEILQRMYGTEHTQNSMPSYVTGQNHRGLLPGGVETERETHRDHPQASNHSPGHTTQPRILNSQVLDRDLDSMQGNLDGRTEFSSLTNPNTCKISGKIELQTQQNQSNPENGQTVESDSRNTGLYSSETHKESAKETPDTGCTKSFALQTPESTAVRLQHKTPAHNPCPIRIKQEKPDYDEGCQAACYFGGSRGTAVKNTLDLMDYINNRRAASEVAKAVVGLSSVIECRCENQPPLYLCVSCSSKLSHDLIYDHLLKPGHRDSYLRRRYPALFEGWSDSDRNQRSVMLMRLAHKVEKTYKDEPGHLQVMKVDCTDLKEIEGLTFDKAILKLQNIRKKQNLCALQTSVLPRNKTVLVKQENIESEVTTQHSPQLADSLDKIAQGSRTASKRTAAEPDSSYQSPTPAKQSKLSTAVTSNAEKLEQTNSRICDHRMSSLPSPNSPKNSAKIPATIMMSSKDPILQKTSHSHANKSNISPSSSKASATRSIDKNSCSTKKPPSLNKPSQKSSVQTKSVAKIKPKISMSDTKVNATESTPGLMPHTGSDLHSDTLARDEPSGSVICKTSSKRKNSESSTLSLLPKKKQSPDEPLSHRKVPKSPVKKSDKTSSDKASDNVSQLQKPQKEPSILYTILSERSQASHPNHTEKATSCQSLDKTVPRSFDVSSRNVDEQASSLKSAAQLPYPDTSGISAVKMDTQGQEIARVQEAPLVIIRSSENPWNYENRQFSHEPVPKTNLVITPGSESFWNIPANDANISAYMCAGDTAMSYPVPAHNANADMYFTKTSESDRANSVTSPVIPPYAMSYQYLVQKQPEYAHTGAASSSSAHNYAVAMNGSALNSEAADPGGYLINTNSAYPSQLAYQSQQVYQPYQTFQSAEAYQAYYSFYAYNQTPPPNQAATFSESVNSAASAYGHNAYVATKPS